MKMATLESPYPYFGRKSKMAYVVWERFWKVQNYVEPFFGSGAVLLARPDFDAYNQQVEIINDKDGMISNFWKTSGGYGNQSIDGRGRKNAERECIWFSPHCVKAIETLPLFKKYSEL